MDYRIRVYDSQTSTTLSNVSYLIDGSSGYTDADGYTPWISGFSPGQVVHWQLSKTGYQTVAGTDTLPNEPELVRYGVVHYITPEGAVAPGSFLVTVFVNDVFGRPVPDADITVDTLTAKSGANGEASFSLAKGTYTFKASKKGYASAQVVQGITQDTFVFLNLTQPLYRLYGSVTDESTGKPIAGAEITYGTMESPHAVGSNRQYTDERGQFSYENVEAGTYNIEVYTAERYLGFIKAITVIQDLGLDIKLTPTPKYYKVTGRVLAKDTGRPITPLNISFSKDTAFFTGGFFSEDGSFYTNKVFTPGSYSLIITAPDQEYKPIEKNINIVDRDLDVGLLEMETCLLNLAIWVKDIVYGDPVKEAVATLDDVQVNAGGDGLIEYKDLVRGKEYTLTVEATGFETLTQPYKGLGKRQPGAYFYQDTIYIKLTPIFKEVPVTGTVTSPMRLPIPKAQVVLKTSNPDQQLYTSATERDGSFSLHVLNWHLYTLTISQKGFDDYTDTLPLKVDGVDMPITMSRKTILSTSPLFKRTRDRVRITMAKRRMRPIP